MPDGSLSAFPPRPDNLTLHLVQLLAQTHRLGDRRPGPSGVQIVASPA